MTIKPSILPGALRPDIDPKWLLATGSANTFAANYLVDPLVHVRLGPGLAAGVGTAVYIHDDRIIEIDSDMMLPGADPDQVDFLKKSWRLLHPLAVGSLLHECSHELATREFPTELLERWKLAKLPYTQTHVDIMMTLEEHRCEAIFAKKYPQARPFFARLVLDIISRNIKLHNTAYSAAGLLALVMGREACGTLTAEQVAPFRQQIETVLSAQQVEALMSLIARYDKAAFSDAEGVHQVITEWLEVLGVDLSDPEESSPVLLMTPQDSDNSATDDPSGDGDGDGESFGEAVARVAAEMGMDIVLDMGDQAQEEADKEAAAANGKNAEEAKEAQKMANIIFTSSAISEKQTHTSTHVTWVDPTAEERAASTLLAQTLQNLAVQDPEIVRTRMTRPGKRLNGRGLMQRYTTEMQGRIPQVPYWDGNHRRIPPNPKLRVGVLVDVSGSMSGYAEPLASTAYILSQSITKADGEFTTIAFGSSAYGVIRSGQVVTKKPLIYPCDGWENIRDAITGADGELGLLHQPDGVRVLFILSDGHYYRPDQHKFADEFFGYTGPKEGVHVVHVLLRPESDMTWLHGNPIPPILLHKVNPLECARILGDTVRDLAEASLAR